VVDRGEPDVSCSEWHADGTAGEHDRGAGLVATVHARAMGEARPGRHEPRWQVVLAARQHKHQRQPQRDRCYEHDVAPASGVARRSGRCSVHSRASAATDSGWRATMGAGDAPVDHPCRCASSDGPGDWGGELRGRDRAARSGRARRDVSAGWRRGAGGLQHRTALRRPGRVGAAWP
jgi:hypothetical protein